MSSMNFHTQPKTITLYGRTITFKARTIHGELLFVPRHITFDVAGYWKVTLNGEVTTVTAGDDLHYSLNVAWKELKRRMSNELPPKRIRPRIREGMTTGKQIDTGKTGVVVYPFGGRCRIHVNQTLHRKRRSVTVASAPMQALTQMWLDDHLALAVLVRERYEALATAGQLGDVVRPEDVTEMVGTHTLPRRVTVAEVVDNYEARNGVRIEPLSLGHNNQLDVNVEAPEGHYRIDNTPALTVAQWLLPRLTRLLKRMTAWLEAQALKLHN